MAFTVGSIAAKDGTTTTVGGGLLAADIAGGGAGPWILFHGLVDGQAGSNRAQVTAANALKVDASGVAVPITDNSGSITVDNGGTFAVQATLAAGATNIAKAEDSASADADVGVPSLAVRKASPANTSGTDGDYEFLQMSAGRLWADAILGDGTNHVAIKAASTAAGATDPALVVAISPNNTVPVSLASVPSHAVTNAGTFAVQATLAAGATNIAKAEDVASADADVGVPAMAVRKATPANTSGTDGDYEMLQMSAGRLWTNSLIGDGTNTAAVKAASTAPVTATDPALVTVLRPDSAGVITTGTAGSPSAQVISHQGVVGGTPAPNLPTLTAAANGLTKSRVNAANSTNATSLKASAGNIGSISLFNVAAYPVFFKLYNKASAPTVGSDTPVWTIPIAAGGGFSEKFPEGDSFATGIAYAITKLQADSDTTVVAAGDLTGQIRWI